MTLWSEIFRERHLLSRVPYGPGVHVITAPTKAEIIRVSMVGAGGWATGGFGHGAAFARVKLACAPGDQFSLQVGDVAHSLDAGDALGDSLMKLLPSNTVVVKAQRGSSTAAGQAANCIGDTKRSGTLANAGAGWGGDAAGDDADPFPLGFGGRGCRTRIAVPLGPVPGGGGAKNYVEYAGSGGFQVLWTMVPGSGRAAVEFFDQDPGY